MDNLTYRDVHDIFIQGQELWHKSLIKESYKGSRTWQNRLRVGSFPTGHGTTQRGYRLGAMAPPHLIEWRHIVAEVCNNNTASFDPHRITFPGSDDYTYSLLRTEAMTDWLNLDGFIYRHAIEEQVAHMEQQLHRINRFIVEQFDRVRYIDATENRWCGLLPCGDAEYCEEDCFAQITSANNEINPMMWRFEAHPNGQPNESIVRVALPWTQLYRISPLCLDILRNIKVELNARDSDFALYGKDEEDGSSTDSMLPENNTGLMEVIVADVRTRAQLERERAFQSRAPGSDLAKEVDPRLGIESVVEDYALRTDLEQMRYAPAPIADQPAANLFSPDDPTTWAILRMVPRLRPVAMSHGITNRINRDWLSAPFSIAIPFVPSIGRIENLPDQTGTGTARKPPHRTPESTIAWKSPDWPFNINGNWGFWMMRHNRAFHPRRTELGHSILYRLDHRVRLLDIMADMPAWRQPRQLDTFCYAPEDRPNDWARVVGIKAI